MTMDLYNMIRDLYQRLARIEQEVKDLKEALNKRNGYVTTFFTIVLTTQAALVTLLVLVLQHLLK